jgi:hypothetical protein
VVAALNALAYHASQGQGLPPVHAAILEGDRKEWDYYEHGGILHYVLRTLTA